MESSPFRDGLVKAANGVTSLFPQGGAGVLDRIFYPLLGNRFLVDYFRKRNQRKVTRLPVPGRILVVSDIHIGDAVLLQTAVSALRDFFPDAKIDYMVKHSVACLLEGHPDISTLRPLFTGGQFPNDQDLQNVRKIAAEYDLVFNFCPFINSGQFPEPQKVFNVVTQAPAFARNEWKGRGINHISYQAHRFIYEIFHPLYPLRRARAFEGPALFLSQGAAEAAGRFEKESAGGEGPMVFLNPETASPFTQIPVRHQAEILSRLAELPCRILMGEGHSDKGLAEKILWSLPIWKRGKVALVPSRLPLDVYAALQDRSDVFISGDTGPLHLAAALKKSRERTHAFRNRTSVISVFGATPPRLSGYDSFREDYLEAGQEAPSRVVQSESSCRNFSCMHKMGKACDSRGCFRALDVDSVLSGVRDRFLSPA